jgi:hypothetical protein
MVFVYSNSYCIGDFTHPLMQERDKSGKQLARIGDGRRKAVDEMNDLQVHVNSEH